MGESSKAIAYEHPAPRLGDRLFCYMLVQTIDPDVVHIHVDPSYLDLTRPTFQSCMPFVKDRFKRLSYLVVNAIFENRDLSALI